MRTWSARARNAAREMAEVLGLRVECLACSWRGRWWKGDGAGDVRHGPTWRAAPTQRLRDVRCPVCGEIALRSVFWVDRHPELAADAKQRAQSRAHALR